VNGRIVTALGTKVDPENDRVTFKGRVVRVRRSHVYIALNKPAGYVSSCKQPREKIVVDLLDIPRRVYPVGRLDKDSTGLLLLTDDGRLHNRLSHPSYDHEKEYVVTTVKPISNAALRRMASGMLLEGKKTRPAVVKRMAANRFRIVLKEGRNRQIRKMVGKTGNGVGRLKRVRIAHIRLGRLEEGRWRYLSKEEVKRFFAVPPRRSRPPAGMS